MLLQMRVGTEVHTEVIINAEGAKQGHPGWPEMYVRGCKRRQAARTRVLTEATRADLQEGGKYHPQTDGAAEAAAAAVGAAVEARDSDPDFAPQQGARLASGQPVETWYVDDGAAMVLSSASFLAFKAVQAASRELDHTKMVPEKSGAYCQTQDMDAAAELVEQAGYTLAAQGYREHGQAANGFKLLGSPFGSPEYIKAALDNDLDGIVRRVYMLRRCIWEQETQMHVGLLMQVRQSIVAAPAKAYPLAPAVCTVHVQAAQKVVDKELWRVLGVGEWVPGCLVQEAMREKLKAVAGVGLGLHGSWCR